MRVSVEWLREFVDIGVSERVLAERLTLAGLAVEAVEGAGAEAVLDLDVTTNRPDCLNHCGVAREIAAVLRQPLRPLPPEDRGNGAGTKPGVRVTIEAPEGCARYCARVFDGVKVAASPREVARRLQLVGAGAINNVVDASNYVLLEMGQPTHAFDADRLRGGELRVRYARSGENLVTLDDVERRLDPHDLVIADAERPVALAGVMGGAETAISERTRRVVLESAWFEPTGIRRTAKRHGMHTDASHRFERGADLEAPPVAANLIAAMFRRLASAEAAGGAIDVYPRRFEPAAIKLRALALERLLGAPVAESEIAEILNRLGFTLCASAAGEWLATAPSWRADIKREADLIEEVARIYGFERFPRRLPAFHGAAWRRPEARLSETIRQRLRGRGYSEVVPLVFAARAECELFTAPETIDPVEVLNPIREQAPIMRTSMLPSMLDTVANNLNRGQENLRFFEVGRTYARRPHSARVPEGTDAATLNIIERPMLAIAGCGQAEGVGWAASPRGFDFFDLKADVAQALDAAELPEILYAPLKHPAFHPTRAAIVKANGRAVGRLGQVAGDVAARWKLKRDVYLAEIHLDWLYSRGARGVHYRPPSEYQASERDFSFIFGDQIIWHEIVAAVRRLAIKTLVEITPVEVFRGGKVPEGSYSILIRLKFQSSERTLRDEEINSAGAQVVGALEALGGVQRK